MIQQTTHGAASGNAIAAGVNEANILADIRYFEARIETAAASGDSRDQAMRRVYASLLAHRRQMLAALRDGRPDAWYEYEHVVV
ncbi:MAG TPA: hypothetical protein VF275_02635 [Gammaproteobacteria bacterium]